MNPIPKTEESLRIMLQILKQKPTELKNPVLDALRADVESQLELIIKKPNITIPNIPLLKLAA